MKKSILILAVFALFSARAGAQAPQNTVLNIEVTVQQEVVRRGPYARYAQPLLGVVAPLSDKDIFSLLSASVSATPAEPRDPAAEQVLPTLSFDGVPIDKMSTAELSLEQAAAEAARTLFTLRRRRFDLVTGEAGENVYGAGMEAALQEMKRLEEEYIALFMGRRTVRTVTKTIRVIPEKGRNTQVVARFTENAGLLPDDDLSGRPIVLELTPESRESLPAAAPPRSGRNAPETVTVRTGERVHYRLIDEGTVLSAGETVIHQFGETVEVPAETMK